jgi:antitoxin VapB
MFKAYANGVAMNTIRTVSLFRNGRNQAIRIPVEFELPGDEATIRKEGDALIIEPKRRKTLLEALDEMEPVPDFPDVDDNDLLPLRDIDLE